MTIAVDFVESTIASVDRMRSRHHTPDVADRGHRNTHATVEVDKKNGLLVNWNLNSTPLRCGEDIHI
ncbi:hypothetical protein SERLA73DRAFT_139242, partial [Serpula lacrymans var. lacrymans S7.3]